MLKKGINQQQTMGTSNTEIRDQKKEYILGKLLLLTRIGCLCVFAFLVVMYGFVNQSKEPFVLVVFMAGLGSAMMYFAMWVNIRVFANVFVSVGLKLVYMFKK